MPNSEPQIVLASSSAYRKRQLTDQLGMPVTSISPNVNESTFPRETASEMAARLSQDKALAVEDSVDPGSLIIAGDQTAEFAGRRLTKPGSMQAAEAQLKELSGKQISFYSGVCVLRAKSSTVKTAVTETQVKFRHLTTSEISAYIDIDEPFDCVGAFKNEQLGIVLFEKITSDDPSALTGLPLIALNNMLLSMGVNVLQLLQKQNTPPNISPKQ